jgi:hypothetical protein
LEESRAWGTARSPRSAGDDTPNQECEVQTRTDAAAHVTEKGRRPVTADGERAETAFVEFMARVQEPAIG